MKEGVSMNVSLFLVIAAMTFVLGLVFSFSSNSRKDAALEIIKSLIIAIASGVIANVISYAITYEWHPRKIELSPEIPVTVSPNYRDDEVSSEPVIKVGQIIQFGSYPQTSAGIGPLDWIVLAQKDNMLLVVSREAIDCQKYHSQNIDVTWETCSLRSWLNNTFYNAAFSSEEKGKIQTTIVTADQNPQYTTNPGNNTLDKLFLLSIQEATQYFDSDNERECRATQYAISQGAYESVSTGCSWWWLRTPGISNKDAASVNSDGSIDYDDGSVVSSKGTVRPAMWIEWTD